MTVRMDLAVVVYMRYFDGITPSTTAEISIRVDITLNRTIFELAARMNGFIKVEGSQCKD